MLEAVAGQVMQILTFFLVCNTEKEKPCLGQG